MNTKTKPDHLLSHSYSTRYGALFMFIYALVGAVVIALAAAEVRLAMFGLTLVVWGAVAGVARPLKFLQYTLWLLMGFVLIYGYTSPGVNLWQLAWTPTIEGAMQGLHMYVLLAALGANSALVMGQCDPRLWLVQAGHVPVVRQGVVLIAMTLVWVTRLPHLYGHMRGKTKLERLKALVWHALWEEESKMEALMGNPAPVPVLTWGRLMLWALWPAVLAVLLWAGVDMFS